MRSNRLRRNCRTLNSTRSFPNSHPIVLTRGRVTIARDAFRREDANLLTIVEAMGYESDTAFSLAFKRQFGRRPWHHRCRMQRIGAAAWQATGGEFLSSGSSLRRWLPNRFTALLLPFLRNHRWSTPRCDL
jgi:AraC-like DNA-binding protein